MARKKKKGGASWRAQILLISALLVGVMFSACAVLLIIGMIPTIVAAIVDRTKGKVKTLAVGAINLAGCAPFLTEVFKKGNEMSVALAYILEPRTIVVMYMAAAIGYLIDWSVTGVVSSIMVQRAKKRLADIQKQQKELIDRWGPEVTGTIPLDEYGFPKDSFAKNAEE